jgi:hypothetical protein
MNPMARTAGRKATSLAIAALVATFLPSAARSESPDIIPIDCPASVGSSTRCSSAVDESGAIVVIAIPADWNRRLIVHAHGGPRTGEPEAADSIQDLDRFAVMVRAGYAWIGSTYRRGGYGVRMAAEDTDNSRELFWDRFGRPERTLLHGQSWGGNVAAKAAELHALDLEGRPNYDGVLLTNGVLSGGTRAYGFRADLRAVYQFYCQNHPRPDEPAYPLWQGLPIDSTLTRPQLRQRVEACTGVDRPASQRTPDQAMRLRNITQVIGIAEEEVVSHLSWATFLFQDLVLQRLGGRNPFDNSLTVYSGSTDDAALNAGVARFQADPDGLARLAYDADLSGLIVAPTVSLHARHDPTVSFTAEDLYRQSVSDAGREHLLLQIASDEQEHSKLADSGYLAILAGLEAWLDTGERPGFEDLRKTCEQAERLPADCKLSGSVPTRSTGRFHAGPWPDLAGPIRRSTTAPGS